MDRARRPGDHYVRQNWLLLQRRVSNETVLWQQEEQSCRRGVRARRQKVISQRAGRMEWRYGGQMER